MTTNAQILEKITQAIAIRLPLMKQAQALRLFDGPGDGLAGVTIDKFAEVLVVHLIQAAGDVSSALTAPSFWTREILQLAGVEAAYLWTHQREARETARCGAVLVAGAARAESSLREGDLTFLVRPQGQVNAGFFIDMRELRARLYADSVGKRVLNLFCFSGSLGVAAYAGGAAEVVQVDVSKAALRWARDNLALNQAPGRGEMRFIPEDAVTFLEKEARRVQRGSACYDTIIVDPPAFGTSAQGKFSFERDASLLLDRCLQVTASSATIVLTTNQRGMSAALLKSRLEAAAQVRSVSILSMEKLLPPRQDFTAGEVDSIAMRGWWCMLKGEVAA